MTTGVNGTIPGNDTRTASVAQPMPLRVARTIGRGRTVHSWKL